MNLLPLEEQQLIPDPAVPAVHPLTMEAVACVAGIIQEHQRDLLLLVAQHTIVEIPHLLLVAIPQEALQDVLMIREPLPAVPLPAVIHRVTTRVVQVEVTILAVLEEVIVPVVELLGRVVVHQEADDEKSRVI